MIYYIFKLFLSFFYRKEESERKGDVSGKTSAIIPAYNESIDSIRMTIRSLSAQVDEIILIDDGSKRPIEQKHLYGFEHVKIALIRSEENRGKKAAIESASKYLSEDSEFVLVADSDTVFMPGFVRNALRTFDSDTGIVSGNLRILNDSGVNKIMQIPYYNSFNVSRAAFSLLRQVAVCSGAVSIYRREAWHATLGAYVDRNVNGGEDRYRTYLAMRLGYATKVSLDSIALTKSPTGWKLIKQQVRWSRSFWRALVYSRSLYLRARFIPYTVDMAFNLIFRVSGILAVLFLGFSIATGNFTIIFLAIIFAIFRGMASATFAAAAERKPFFILRGAAWGIFSLFIIAPVHLFSLATARKDSWGNR